MIVVQVVVGVKVHTDEKLETSVGSISEKIANGCRSILLRWVPNIQGKAIESKQLLRQTRFTEQDILTPWQSHHRCLDAHVLGSQSQPNA